MGGRERRVDGMRIPPPRVIGGQAHHRRAGPPQAKGRGNRFEKISALRRRGRGSNQAEVNSHPRRLPAGAGVGYSGVYFVDADEMEVSFKDSSTLRVDYSWVGSDKQCEFEVSLGQFVGDQITVRAVGLSARSEE